MSKKATTEKVVMRQVTSDTPKRRLCDETTGAVVYELFVDGTEPPTRFVRLRQGEALLVIHDDGKTEVETTLEVSNNGWLEKTGEDVARYDGFWESTEAKPAKHE